MAGLPYTALATSTNLRYTSNPASTGIGDHLCRVYVPVFFRPFRPVNLVISLLSGVISMAMVSVTAVEETDSSAFSSRPCYYAGLYVTVPRGTRV